MTTSHEHPDRDLADEVFTGRSAPTTVLPTYEMPVVSADPAIGEPTDLGAPASRPVTSEPAWLTGPAPTPVIIGLIGLLTLVFTAVWSLTEASVNWSVAAPAAIIGIGLVIVVLGLTGLRKRA